MDDLISRSWLLSEYDKRHKGPPGGARKLIEEAPSAQPKNENLKFLEFLWNTINPNEMEQYLEMYSSKEVKSNG